MIDEFEHLRVVDDEAEIKAASILLREIVDSDIHLNMNWLHRKQFVAVPVENLGYFDDKQRRRIADAIEHVDIIECLAIATEDWADVFPPVLVVPANYEGLSEFNWKLAACGYLLLAPNQAFAILCTGDYYNLIAGPVEFLEAAIEGGVAGARQWFRSFAEDWDTPKQVQIFLDIAERYESTG